MRLGRFSHLSFPLEFDLPANHRQGPEIKVGGGSRLTRDQPRLLLGPRYLLLPHHRRPPDLSSALRDNRQMIALANGMQWHGQGPCRSSRRISPLINLSSGHAEASREPVGVTFPSQIAERRIYTSRLRKKRASMNYNYLLGPLYTLVHKRTTGTDFFPAWHFLISHISN